MKKAKERIFKIIQEGEKGDTVSVIFDYFIMATVFVNLFVSFFSTFDESAEYLDAIIAVEYVTAVIFTVEYILRVWTADCLYPDSSPVKSRIKFIFSFYGLVDFLSFAPVLLPGVSLGSSMVAVRLLRTLRVFKLFRINSQYDAFTVITDVLKEKKEQILSSVSLIFILMLAASMGIYSLEHDAQPEAYQNAFSGMWWSVSTMLTIGYGDVYPVTILGKLFTIVISFLGVGLVAVPTGIISAGFVEYYSDLKYKEYYGEENSLMLYEVVVKDRHEWVGKRIMDLNISRQETVVCIERDNEKIIPESETVINAGDIIYLFDKEQDGHVGTVRYKKSRLRPYV